MNSGESQKNTFAPKIKNSIFILVSFDKIVLESTCSKCPSVLAGKGIYSN